jgi:hypothetical protein
MAGAFVPDSIGAGGGSWCCNWFALMTAVVADQQFWEQLAERMLMTDSCSSVSRAELTAQQDSISRADHL